MTGPDQQTDTEDSDDAVTVQIIDVLGTLIAAIERRFPEDVAVVEVYTRLRNRLMGTVRPDDQQLVAEGDSAVGDGSSTTVINTIGEEDAGSVTMEKDDGETTRLRDHGQVVVAKEEAVASSQEIRAEYNAWLKRFDENITRDLEKEEVAGVENETYR